MLHKTDRDRLDKLTAAIHYLLKGNIPEAIDVSTYPADEIKQLSEKVNHLVASFAEVRDCIIPLAQGFLDRDIRRHNLLASPFKQLQANLRHLTWQTQQIAQGDFSQRVDFMGDFSVAFNSMVVALEKARQELRDLNTRLQQEVVSQASSLERARMLRKYLPPAVAQKILEENQPIKIEQKRQPLTVFRLELRGFKAMTRILEPEDMAAMLNSYLSAVVEVAFAYGATVDKLIQDEVVGFFGAPTSQGQEADAISCAKMARELWSRAVEICGSWRELQSGPPPVPTVAIASGYGIVGNFGTSNRLEYTAVGGPVIESMSILQSIDHGQAVCCQRTARLIKDVVDCHYLHQLSVPSKMASIRVFRLAGPLEALPDDSSWPSRSAVSASLITSGQDPPHTIKSPPPPALDGPSTEGSFRMGEGCVIAKRYTIVKRLGQGGMGTVYLARDQKLDIDIALKTVRHDTESAESTGSKRLHREVKLARLINHPNVAQVFNINLWQGLEFITMEYIEGKSLTSVLKEQGALGLDQGRQVFKQICAGLAAAHLVGVVHRDLKPANIMMEPTGRIIILDFGIAKATSGALQTLTETHGITGTPHYMAPEQFEGKELDQRTDIYALGVVAYELFTNQRPFSSDNVFSLAFKHTQQPPRNPQELRCDLPPRVAAIILRCLEKAPQDRFDAVEEILAML